MEPFRILDAIAAPLAESGIDTDQLCPSRFIRIPYGEGYDRILLHDLRFNADGQERPGFVLNQPAYRGAQILVAGPNFGVGSSREGAVAALQGYGFRCVIAPSFGDILFDNCFRRGILAVVLPQAVVGDLLELLTEAPGQRLVVDLERQVLTWPGGSAEFQTGPMRRRCLLDGIDPLEMAGRHEAQIDAHEADVAARRPWLGSLRMPI